jgi:polyisoprenoid-binding protein YceI
LLRHSSALLIGFGLMIACGTPVTRVEPTSAPTPIPAAAAPPTSLPTTTIPGAPTPLATAASAAPTTAVAAAPKVSTTASSGLRLSLREDSSEARFRVTEQLTGRPLPGDAIGRTRAVTGTIALNPAGAILAEQSRITVDLRTLRSDESRRDNFIQRNTLETSQYPNAEFVPREAQGLPAPLPTSGEAVFQLLGDLTVHGVTRPVTWEVTASFGEQEITGSALTNVKLTDFNMTPPRVGPVLSIEDAAKLELDFLATRETPAGPAPGDPSSPAA